MKTTNPYKLVAALAGAVAFTMAPTRVQAQESRYEDLANLPFVAGYIAKDNTPALLDESLSSPPHAPSVTPIATIAAPSASRPRSVLIQ